MCFLHAYPSRGFALASGLRAGGPYLKETCSQAILRQNFPTLLPRSSRLREEFCPSLDGGARYVHGSGASPVHVWARSQETIHFTVRLSRLRGFAHVLVRRPSSNRRREHPTHTFVLPPRRARRGWELACRELLPTDEFIRLSSVPATPIRLTSCSLPVGQTQPACARANKPNPWATTSSPTPRGMNDNLTSSIYHYPRRIPKHLPGSLRSQSCKHTPDPHIPPQVLIRSKQQVS